MQMCELAAFRARGLKSTCWLPRATHGPSSRRAGLNRFLHIVGMAAGSLCLLFTIGCGVDRTLIIESEPPGAAVLLNGIAQEAKTPMTIQKVHWNEPSGGGTTTNEILLRLQDHETLREVLNYETARTAKNPWRLQHTLAPLSRPISAEITSVPSGAEITVSGNVVGTTPQRVSLRFARSSGKSEWEPVRVSFRMANHLSKQMDVTMDEAMRGQIHASLIEVRRDVPVSIVSNISNSEVVINGNSIGTTPMQHVLSFTRKDDATPWNQYIVEVRKDGYRRRRAQGPLAPGDTSPFTATITLDEAMRGTISADLEPIRFVRTRLRRWEFSGSGVSIGQEVVLAEVGEIETEPKVQAVTSVTDMPAGEFMISRISVAPPQQQVVYSKPLKVPDAVEVYSNLWRQAGQGVTRLTDGPKIDLEPAASADGKFIYFSSNRLRPDKFNLWRMQTSGQGGLTKITDSPASVADTEPAVSPDGTRIAFVSYLNEGGAPQIWIANADGTLPTQLRVGKNPAWSPDGTRLAFVAPDDSGYDQVWVMTADGSNPTLSTTGDSRHAHPVWTPDGSRILYASNQAVNAEGERNYDIWVMNIDGTGRTQLTVNGSYDTRPAVSPDGRFVYFISNRGARREFDDNWQIWRIELAQEK